MEPQAVDSDPRSHALLVETVRELENELRGRDLSLESQQITIEKQRQDIERLQALCESSPEARDDVRDALLRENERLQHQLSRLGNGVTGASVAAELQLDMMQRARKRLSLQLQALKPLNDQYARLLEKDAPAVPEEEANDDFVQGELTRFKLYNQALFGVLERRDNQLRALLDIHSQLRRDKFEAEARLEALQRTDPYAALRKEETESESLRAELKKCKSQLAKARHAERTLQDELQRRGEEVGSSRGGGAVDNAGADADADAEEDDSPTVRQLQQQLQEKDAVLRELGASLATLTAAMEAQGQQGQLEQLAADRKTTLGRTRAELIRLQADVKSAQAKEAAAVQAKEAAQQEATSRLEEVRQQHARTVNDMQDRLDQQAIEHSDQVEAMQEQLNQAAKTEAGLQAELKAATEMGKGAERASNLESALSEARARQAEASKLLSLQLISLQTGLAELAEALPGSPRKRRHKAPHTVAGELFDAEFLSAQLDTLGVLTQRMREHVQESAEKEKAQRTRAATAASRASELDALARAKQERVAGLEEDLVKLQAALRSEQRARTKLQREGRVQANSKRELEQLELHVHALERVVSHKSDMIRDLEVILETELGWSAADRKHALAQLASSEAAPGSTGSVGGNSPKNSISRSSSGRSTKPSPQQQQQAGGEERKEEFSVSAGLAMHTHGMDEEDELAMLQRELAELRQY